MKIKTLDYIHLEFFPEVNEDDKIKAKWLDLDSGLKDLQWVEWFNNLPKKNQDEFFGFDTDKIDYSESKKSDSIFSKLSELLKKLK